MALPRHPIEPRQERRHDHARNASGEERAPAPGALQPDQHNRHQDAGPIPGDHGQTEVRAGDGSFPEVALPSIERFDRDWNRPVPNAILPFPGDQAVAAREPERGLEKLEDLVRVDSTELDNRQQSGCERHDGKPHPGYAAALRR